MAIANKRIDAGIKRGPKRPYNTDILPRDVVTKRFLPKIPPEQRIAILQDAIDSLPQGQSTETIAKRHGISGGLLRQWLLVDDTANQARSAWFASELDTARQSIKDSLDPLTLARAREDFRSIAWLAERRNAAHWGQQQQMVIDHRVTFTQAIAEISRRRLEVDVTPDATGVSVGVSDQLAVPDTDTNQ